jgi:hypothetical protein
MGYEEPDLPVAGNPVSTSGFGFKVRNSLIWIKEQLDILLVSPALTISKRQGGSATDCSTPGTTNYTPTTSVEQIGVAAIAFGSGTAQATTVTVTFPVEFTDVPHLTFSVEYVSGNDLDLFAYFYSLTKTAVIFELKRDVEKAAATSMNIHWRATYAP